MIWGIESKSSAFGINGAHGEEIFFFGFSPMVSWYELTNNQNFVVKLWSFYIVQVFQFTILLSITLFHHVDRFHVIGICQIYYTSPLSKNDNICLLFINLSWHGDLGEVILPAICAGMIVHPRNIIKKQCSSHQYQ